MVDRAAGSNCVGSGAITVKLFSVSYYKLPRIWESNIQQISNMSNDKSNRSPSANILSYIDATEYRLRLRKLFQVSRLEKRGYLPAPENNGMPL